MALIWGPALLFPCSWSLKPSQPAAAFFHLVPFRWVGTTTPESPAISPIETPTPTSNSPSTSWDHWASYLQILKLDIMGISVFSQITLLWFSKEETIVSGEIYGFNQVCSIFCCRYFSILIGFSVEFFSEFKGRDVDIVRYFLGPSTSFFKYLHLERNQRRLKYVEYFSYVCYIIVVWWIIRELLSSYLLPTNWYGVSTLI